jgi:hypothetical protein
VRDVGGARAVRAAVMPNVLQSRGDRGVAAAARSRRVGRRQHRFVPAATARRRPFFLSLIAPLLLASAQCRKKRISARFCWHSTRMEEWLDAEWGVDLVSYGGGREVGACVEWPLEAMKALDSELTGAAPPPLDDAARGTAAHDVNAAAGKEEGELPPLPAAQGLAARSSLEAEAPSSAVVANPPPVADDILRPPPRNALSVCSRGMQQRIRTEYENWVRYTKQRAEWKFHVTEDELHNWHDTCCTFGPSEVKRSPLKWDELLLVLKKGRTRWPGTGNGAGLLRIGAADTVVAPTDDAPSSVTKGKRKATEGGKGSKGRKKARAAAEATSSTTIVIRLARGDASSSSARASSS